MELNGPSLGRQPLQPRAARDKKCSENGWRSLAKDNRELLYRSLPHRELQRYHLNAFR
jgi:hypothetical protein